MTKSLGRRAFLASAGALGAAVGQAAAQPATAPAPAAAAKAALPPAPAGYVFLRPAEAAFVEAVANHMVPADELTPSGVDLGIPVYVDRALAGGWGKGDRLYAEGPWQAGTPNQGYQLALTPAELYRAGIAQANGHCRKAYDGKTFDRLAAAQKEAFLQALASGKVDLPGGLPARPFFDLIYQTVMEGMFADPIYGGNRDKAAWKMIGFPGVMANNAANVRTYNDGRRFPAKPVGIADMS
ncbi:MAG: gluconate 2-dehydrogenase subunit 3 family protein [Phenylobacterium sp.]